MFKFLKDKLKKAVSTFSKKAEDEIEETIVTDEKTIEQAKKEEEKLAQKKATELEDTPAAKTHRKEEPKKQPEQSKEKPKPVPEKKPESTKPARIEPVTPKVKKPENKKPAVTLEEPQESKPIRPKRPEPTPKAQELSEETIEPKETKKSFFKRMLPEKKSDSSKSTEAGILGKVKETFTKIQLSDEKFEEIFWELELILLENNVAVEVIEKIKHDLREELTTGKVTRRGVEQLISGSLKKSIDELFMEPYDLVEKIESANKRPFVIAFIGVNGSGKTTTLAKIANLFQQNELSVVMAASDTFRAAAIDQLKTHADKLGVKLISQGYGADPAAVAFDAIEHAKARDIDVVMIDTAGRLHSNTNLMAELEKVVRVAKPDLKIFIGESITGNDCVEQAQQFDKLVGIDAIILSKADVDEKGGAAISISYVTGKPILYLGTGQAYGDLEPFDAERIISTLGLE